MPRIYGSPSYAMGNSEKLVKAAATAPVTSAGAARGKVELGKMRRSLASWLKYRTLNDRVTSGQPIQRPVLRAPGRVAISPQMLAVRLRRQRVLDEQELATQLHELLSEVFDGASLPEVDIAKNPQAAVQLAKIVIAGQLPGETQRAAVGALWMWPLVIVIGIVAFTIMTSIRSSADVAKERERLECIKAGACTDSGFFLKLGAVALIGWLLWSKAGLGERVKGALSK